MRVAAERVLRHAIDYAWVMNEAASCRLVGDWLLFLPMACRLLDSRVLITHEDDQPIWMSSSWWFRGSAVE